MKYTFKNVMILGLGCLLGFTSCSDSWLNTDSTQTAEGDVQKRRKGICYYSTIPY